MKRNKKTSLTKHYAQGSIEFMVVFVVLFALFVGILDISLFFRQVYLVQTVSDEIMARLTVGHLCSGQLIEQEEDEGDFGGPWGFDHGNQNNSQNKETTVRDSSETERVIIDTVYNYFGRNVELEVTDSSNYGISLQSTDADNAFKFTISCRNSATPDVLYFSHVYKGLFWFRSGKIINSNPSSNTSYF